MRAVVNDPDLPELKCPGVETVAEVKTGAPANLDGFTYESDDGYDIDRSPKQRSLIAAGLHTYLEEVGPNEPNVIVVHVHGGLVDRCRGYEDAVSLVPVYRGAGAYPIFPIYNVGLNESVDKGWSGASARDERRHGVPSSMPFTTRFFYPKGLLADDIPDVRSWSIARRWPLLFLVSRRKREHRDHGRWSTAEHWLRYGYVPLLNEGLITGGRAWSYMKWSIDQSFALGSGAQTRPEPPSGLALIKLLHEQTQNHPKTRILLVGHSTGAIWIAKFLRAWHEAYPWEAARFEVAFLAPAVRYDILQQTLEGAGALIAAGRFRTYTMVDEQELNNREGPVPGLRRALFAPSLLYMVSGIFERDFDAPVLGLARFRNPDANRVLHDASYPVDAPLAPLDAIDAVNAWFAANKVDTPFVFSPTPDDAPEGYRTRSCLHGEFPNEPNTQQSLTALVRNTGWLPLAAPGAGTPGSGRCWEPKDAKGNRIPQRANALSKES